MARRVGAVVQHADGDGPEYLNALVQRARATDCSQERQIGREQSWAVGDRLPGVQQSALALLAGFNRRDVQGVDVGFVEQVNERQGSESFRRVVRRVG